MKRMKRLFTCALAIAMLFASIGTMSPVAEATTSRNCHVVTNLTTGGGSRNDFEIKGNLLTKKKVTIDVFLATGQSLLKANKTDTQIAQKYSDFGYIIYDKNGKMVQTDNGLGYKSYFYLPRGSQTYKVAIFSHFKSYNYKSMSTAAGFAVYNLKY